VFSRDVPAGGEVFESGGRLLLPLPQEVEASEVVGPAILKAAAQSREVEVWEAAPGGEYLFRGTRALLQAAPSGSSGRVHLVFEAGADDRGRRGPVTPASRLLPPGTRALVPAIPDLMVELQLNEAQKRLAALPLRNRAIDRQGAFRGAQERLRMAGLGRPEDWRAFAGWLADVKPGLDQDTLESILRMALHTPGVPKAGAMQLAAALLEERSPVNAAFAKSAALALRGNNEPALREWRARLLRTAVSLEPDDADLKLVQAAFAADDGNHVDACRWYREAFADPSAQPAPEDLRDYLVSAGLAGQPEMADESLAVADRVFDRGAGNDDELFDFREALAEAVHVEAGRGRRKNELDRLALLLRVLASCDEEAAVKTWEARCAGDFFKLSDKLDLLSILEDCESPEAILTIGTFAEATARQSLTQKNEALQRQALEQLRSIERLLGDDEHRDSTGFERELESRHVQYVPRLDATPEQPSQSHHLHGRTVVIVGGHPRTRRHVAEELLLLGATVREIPPSSEAHVNESRVRDQVEHADLAAVITDYIGHDLSGIVTKLRSSGMRFDLVRTAFGPSRILADITGAVSGKSARTNEFDAER
jgi:hypothetical protein